MDSGRKDEQVVAGREGLAPWRVVETLAEVRSPWIAVVGERLEESSGRQVDYWRIEKADSVVAVTILDGSLILPRPTYRPGVGRTTLDLPGGRLEKGGPVLDVAAEAVCRELGLPGPEHILRATLLSEVGWDVDSSTSDQKLFGVVLELVGGAPLDPSLVGASYPANEAGVGALLGDVTCLQCRSVVREWWCRL